MIFNLLLQPGWPDYNHLCIFGKSLHQQEYKILRKGFEGGLSKQQISNVFTSQEMLQSPLIAIEKYSGVRNGEIRADFYDDCQNIPDPSALDPMQRNLLQFDDCFLGKQNNAEMYYTRGKHNNCDTIYIAQNYFRLTILLCYICVLLFIFLLYVCYLFQCFNARVYTILRISIKSCL